MTWDLGLVPRWSQVEISKNFGLMFPCQRLVRLKAIKPELGQSLYVENIFLVPTLDMAYPINFLSYISDDHDKIVEFYPFHMSPKNKIDCPLFTS